MKNTILSFHAHTELEKKIKDLAAREQRSIANVIKIALDNYFDIAPEDQAAKVGLYKDHPVREQLSN